jgi:hypothetical protein
MEADGVAKSYRQTLAVFTEVLLRSDRTSPCLGQVCLFLEHISRYKFQCTKLLVCFTNFIKVGINCPAEIQ